MLFSHFGRAALAAATFATPSLAQTSNPPDLGQSTFVAPENNVAFGFTVPENSGEDVFVTIRAPIDRTWAAIGIGQDRMPGSLIFMIYRDETGNGVTFSPRVAYGNYEPTYYDHMKWEVLPGTGVFNGSMFFSARCTDHCRSWPGGWVDVSNENQKAIYAVGPKGGFFSNKMDTSVKFHEEFGRFTINMKRTIGPADAPVLKADSVNEGTNQISANDERRDYKSIFHAILMVGSLVFLIPFGAVLLRFGNMVRWHALNQGVALLIVIVGFVLGVLSSFWYTRSRGFKSPHQIIGFIVVAFLLAQFAIGFLHHQKYKKTHQSTPYKTVHIWLGRIVIALGTFNAFLGFSFALNRKYNYFLAAFIILMLLVSLFITFGGKWVRGRIPAKFGSQAQGGYNPEPWRQVPTQGGFAYGGAPPAYQPPSHQSQTIGLTSMVADPAQPTKERSGSRDYRNNDLGSTQQPREMV
ncbi:Putative cytochrome b561/ferric reductase transmembrane, cellobiose dehydrogenase, cytochrome [Colletotrichum destructivum]|uniref:Cytochrome b561/ferric reductase transmembrane, cellobiose dehydrogenase, cytochrome n=1 Tax=Colletotrichum destructivum TaxID=34406 RepID=A0AAX4J097_9PEZI|nr:Putative cytochrome b561/ferric reductase transmembrane, cellobiose dehydrogenase, cytochrome [Colletotrichum destructivum]